MSGFFFNGRYVTQPQVDVAVDVVSNSGNLNGAYSLVLVGSADDTEPQVINWWTNVPTAQNSLSGGRLYNGLRFATQPLKNAQVGPAKVGTLRVDEATQATLTLSNGATPQLDLTSTSYGLPGNQTAVNVDTGSTQGYLVQIRNDIVGKTISQDNLYRAGFSLYYTGATTNVTATINGTSLTVSGGTTPAVMFTVSFATYSTIQQVVNQINQQAGFVATLLSPVSSDAATDLDWVTSATVATSSTTPTIFTENLYQVNAWLNSGAQPWVTSSIPAGAGQGLTTSSTWTYLTGGTVTAPTNTDWQNAINVLAQDNSIDFIVFLTGQATLHAMLETHCASMAQNGNYRWGHVGGELAETASQQMTRAQNLNSQFMMLNWPGIQSNLVNGTNTTYEPYYTACMTAGARAAQQLPTNIEGQALNVTGLETPTTAYIDELLQSGVAVLKQDKTSGVYVDNAIMTTQNAPSEILRQEVSNMIIGFLARDAKAQVQAQIKGKITTQTLANFAAQVAQNVAEDYYTEGLLVSQPSGFTGTVAGSNAVTVQGSVVDGVPLNFAGITFTASTL